MMRATLITKVRSSYAALLLALLAGCGGGAPTTENANTSGPSRPSAYNGPVAQTPEISAFKEHFWDKMVEAGGNACGQCHADSQTPRFVRSDNINLAFDAANTVVDLNNPGLSRIVAKVRGGHNCWVSDSNVCADQVVRFITNWANATIGGAGKQILLTPPTLADAGPSRVMPATATTPGIGGVTFANSVYPILLTNCAGCHRADGVRAQQQPFFASSDVDVAYEQARTKMNLDLPAMSRLVLRLRNESHNCWNFSGSANCSESARVMEERITQFANSISITPIPAAWQVSKALGLYGGTVASGGNRYETNMIALYEFKTGTGPTAFDGSGVAPAADLTLSGGYQWVGGWGVQFTGGKAQASTVTSAKFNTLIGSTGEYSIEAWAAPANVAQTDTRIVSYSGSATTRNFRLGQSVYNYDFFSRTSASGAGGAQLSTPDAARNLQATLQHVVVTFHPINGRRIYVNGVPTNAQAAGGTSIGTSWDDTFAFVLGNEVSNDKPWLGTLKLVAIHNRALTAPQVLQNFTAGVGEKYLLLFSVSHLINVPQSYVMFEVSQFDSYAYLFTSPKFISLDATAAPSNLVIKGMRIGINGTEPLVGQAYKTLDVTVNAGTNYTAAEGASLSSVGTVINLERGPVADQFFLTFEQLGSAMNVRTEPTPLAPQPPPDVPRPADLGMNTFDGINATFAQITGVQLAGNGAAAGRMRATFQELKQSLPAVANFQGFVAANQIAVAQLAIGFCSEMVDDPALRTAFFGAVNTSSPLTTQPDRDAIINPVIAKVLGSGLSSQPDTALMHTELDLLIDNTGGTRAQGLCRSAACGGTRTLTVMKAVCGAGLASGASIIQ